MTAPTQKLDALQIANTRRIGVANLRLRVAAMPTRAGAEYVADVIENDYADPIAGAAKMRHLLVAVRGVGEHKALRCLRFAGVHGDRRLRDLTPRQRRAVADNLRLFAVTFRGRS